jgi:hypothetical protein
MFRKVRFENVIRLKRFSEGLKKVEYYIILAVALVRKKYQKEKGRS